ncbi:MAG: SAM-dependent methyltransferase [Lyngbya sp. HA4199-MV5]|jgi:SAM-dependent methyltransferase|nr:SAM-dependent methyltransferase [Lyngbya sp. HA4199-MV5]
MAMKLETVVPFGRSLGEYIKMFDLTERDLSQRILGVGDGPASFNAEATKLGYSVTSIDPVYQFSGDEVLARFNAVVDGIVDQVKASPNDWVWSYHQSPEDLRTNRVKAINTFINDYDAGKADGRYRIDALPQLTIPDRAYDLALCSHFLFLYSEQLDYSFHLQSIQEMLRVSREVRIFPLLTLMRERSPHLDPVIETLTGQGYRLAIQKVPYELQKGGNEMLVVTTNREHD